MTLTNKYGEITHVALWDVNYLHIPESCVSVIVYYPELHACINEHGRGDTIARLENLASKAFNGNTDQITLDLSLAEHRMLGSLDVL